MSVLGSYYLQMGSLLLFAFGLATSTGFYSSTMMLVKNIRDIATDQGVKKYTLVVILGGHKARMLLVILIMGALIIYAIFTLQPSSMVWPTTILLVAQRC
jgi:1,4-dihydroxy-2-naphthoate octaprenyltransferase